MACVDIAPRAVAQPWIPATRASIVCAGLRLDWVAGDVPIVRDRESSSYKELPCLAGGLLAGLGLSPVPSPPARAPCARLGALFQGVVSLTPLTSLDIAAGSRPTAAEGAPCRPLASTATVSGPSGSCRCPDRPHGSRCGPCQLRGSGAAAWALPCGICAWRPLRNAPSAPMAVMIRRTRPLESERAARGAWRGQPASLTGRHARAPTADGKTFKKPRRPFEKERLDSELKQVGEFGLRNKRELWRVQMVLSKMRSRARDLLTLDEKDPRRAPAAWNPTGLDCCAERAGQGGAWCSGRGARAAAGAEARSPRRPEHRLAHLGTCRQGWRCSCGALAELGASHVPPPLCAGVSSRVTRCCVVCTATASWTRARTSWITCWRSRRRTCSSAACRCVARAGAAEGRGRAPERCAALRGAAQHDIAFSSQRARAWHGVAWHGDADGSADGAARAGGGDRGGGGGSVAREAGEALAACVGVCCEWGLGCGALARRPPAGQRASGRGWQRAVPHSAAGGAAEGAQRALDGPGWLAG